MNIPRHEIVDLLQQLAEHENIRICVKQSALIGTITGIGALVGGLLAGRNGALAGAAIGTVASGMIIDDYVSVTHVIMNEMSSEQRQRLIQSTMNILMELREPITLYAILNSSDVKESLISLLQSSVRNSGYLIS